ncbi:MAG: helix-turn-helix domain-containing protein [Phycisphaerales bacterium]
MSERTAYRFCQSGLVPAYRVGGRWRIPHRRRRPPPRTRQGRKACDRSEL